MNVCGLQSKVENGIFIKYIEHFDIVCLCETKTHVINNDLIPGFKSICKARGDQGHPYGGIHGMCILFKDRYAGLLQEIGGMTSDCILWVKIDKRVIGFEFVIRAVYIPHEGSKYHNNDLFDNIADDIIKIKIEYNLPLLLVGDFNARTGHCNDFNNLDNNRFVSVGIDNDNLEMGDSKFQLQSLGLCKERYSYDKSTNNNGRRLIEFCKSLDVHIVNGRIGDDYRCGRFTCADSSLIDYAIASPELFVKIKNISVDLFDKFLSDKHNPICLTVRSELILPRHEPPDKIRPSSTVLSIQSGTLG